MTFANDTDTTPDHHKAWPLDLLLITVKMILFAISSVQKILHISAVWRSITDTCVALSAAGKLVGIVNAMYMWCMAVGQTKEGLKKMILKWCNDEVIDAVSYQRQIKWGMFCLPYWTSFWIVHELFFFYLKCRMQYFPNNLNVIFKNAHDLQISWTHILFPIEHKEHIWSWNWDILSFHGKYLLILTWWQQHISKNVMFIIV